MSTDSAEPRHVRLDRLDPSVAAFVQKVYEAGLPVIISLNDCPLVRIEPIGARRIVGNRLSAEMNEVLSGQTITTRDLSTYQEPADDDEAIARFESEGGSVQ